MNIISCKNIDEIKGPYINFHLTPVDTLHPYLQVKSQLREGEAGFTRELLSWHRDLINSQNMNKDVMLFEGSRLLTERFENLFFARAAAKVIPTGLSNIYVLGAPKDSLRILAEILSGKLKSKYTFSEFRSDVRSFLSYHYHGIRSILPNVIRQPKAQDIEVLCFSMWLQGADRRKHFYGSLLDGVESTVYLNVIPGEKAKPDKSYGFSTSRVSIINSIQILFLLLKVSRLPWKALKGGPFLGSRSFQRSYVHKYFKTPYQAALVYCHLKDHLKRNTVKNLIFPYEDKIIERAIILAVKESENMIRTIGYAHAAYNENQLYLHRRCSKGLHSSLTPDFIASTGPSQRSWFINYFGYSAEEVKSVGSHRYINADQSLYVEVGERRILVLTALAHELRQFANHIKKFSKFFSSYKIIIRRHPIERSAEDDGIISELKSDFNLIEEEKSLDQQILESNMVIFSATTAGIEAMLLGKVAIYLDMGAGITHNPLAGKNGAEKIPQCSSGAELVVAVKNYHKKDVGKEFKEFAGKVFCPISSENVRDLFL